MAPLEWNANDAEVVLMAITAHEVCLPCIAARLGGTRARVEAVVVTFSETLTIERRIAR